MEKPSRYLNRFYYYLGIVRSIDQEMTAIGKIIYYTYSSQERENRSHPWGATEGGNRVSTPRGRGRNRSKHLYCGFQGKEQADRVNRLRIGQFVFEKHSLGPTLRGGRQQGKEEGRQGKVTGSYHQVVQNKVCPAYACRADVKAF